MRDGHPQLLTMENNSALLPSMLCAPTREAVSEWLYRHHDVPATDEETRALLRRAIRYNREEDIEVGAQSVQFGLASLAHYIDDPGGLVCQIAEILFRRQRPETAAGRAV